MAVTAIDNIKTDKKSFFMIMNFKKIDFSLD